MLNVSRDQIGIILAQCDFVKHNIFRVWENTLKRFGSSKFQPRIYDMVDNSININLMNMKLFPRKDFPVFSKYFLIINRRYSVRQA